MKRPDFELTCLCESEFDLDQLLTTFLREQRHLELFTEHAYFTSVELEDLHTLLCEPMLFSNSEVRWSADHPPITVSVLPRHLAAHAAREAQLEFSEILRDNPDAWYSNSEEVRRLGQRLAGCTFVTNWRGPQIDARPVKRAPFWLALGMAEAAARHGAGFMRLRDGVFVLRDGRMVGQ